MSNEWDDIECLPIVVGNGRNQLIEQHQEQQPRFVTEDELIAAISSNSELNANLIDFKRKYSNIWSKILNYLLFWKYHEYNFIKSQNLICEANRIVQLATQPFNNTNHLHFQCLYTIYTKLTGGNLSNGLNGGMKRYGPHWERIGFQGSDPSTDLRGVGLLGLFQLTFFVIDSKYRDLCKEIYGLSMDHHQHYPFAVTSMNMTQISLQLLRDGHLNYHINRSNSVLNVFNEFYYGTFLCFHLQWKNDHKTIVDIGFILKGMRSNTLDCPESFGRFS